MPTSRLGKLLLTLAVLLLVAGAVYLNRARLAPYVPFLAQKEEGGYKVVLQGGVKYKECYVCTMHPQIVRPKPGDCPICGMSLVKKLVPVEGEKKAEQPPAPAMQSMSGMPGMEMPAQKPSGTAAAPQPTSELQRVSLDPRQRMLANVQTTKVARKYMSQDVYTVGKIAIDEQAVRRVSSRYPGRVERLDVNFTGQRVRKGQRIMSIYSPEIIATEKEYLIAKESMERLASSEFKEISQGTAGVLDAARTRMKLWGMTDSQIEELDKTRNVKTTVDVYSPISGTVVELMVREGDYVSEGSPLYRIADLGRVWMLADVFERDFQKVNMGSVVEVTAEGYPGRSFHGVVVFMDPTVNPESRTLKVRTEFPNPDGLLRPEMFVNAKILSKPITTLTVPASAILYTGTRNVAWAEVEPGVFEHRDVKLGMRSGDEYQVLSGLKEGESVVTQGGFLIDSEAQLRESAGGASMAGMPGMEQKK